MWRPQQNHVTKVSGNQRQAPQYERSHENFTQFGVPAHQRAQVLRSQLQKFSRLRHPPANQARPPGNHVHLAGEFTRGMLRYRSFLPTVRLHDLHRAGEQYKKRDRGIARLEENLSGIHLSKLAEGTRALDLRSRERRKYLRSAVERAGRRKRCRFVGHKKRVRAPLGARANNRPEAI